jgi:hypothetical protein
MDERKCKLPVYMARIGKKTRAKTREFGQSKRTPEIR